MTSEVVRPWFRELNRYHWFVLVVCTLGWAFDCFNQQMFALNRKDAFTRLLAVEPGDPRVEQYTGIATSVLMIGWATGGIIFGILGDRLGRAKTMVLTILMFSVFTGLISLSYSVYDFMLYQFLTGLGVGGQFAVGVSLVAETMPAAARPHALGMLQAFSTLANVTAALCVMGFGQLEKHGLVGQGVAWRWMFSLGILPALLAVVVMRRLKEPESWQKAVAQGGGKKAGSLAELFGVPRWRRNAIVGLLLASSGVIGLWGIGFFSIDLNQSIFRKVYQQEARDRGEAQMDRQFVRSVTASPECFDKVLAGAKKVDPKGLLGLEPGDKNAQLLYAKALELRAAGKTVSSAAVLDALDHSLDPQSPQQRARRAEYLAGPADAPEQCAAHVAHIAARQAEINGKVRWWASITSILFNLGAFCGVYTFSRVTARIGRKPAFAISFVLAGLATAMAFLWMSRPTQVYWMVPTMGFCQFLLFGGYAIYFAELFPTRLRSTGTSFCYNIGRYVAALGPSALGLLTSVVYAGQGEPMRYAGVTMCGTFLVGLLVLPFAPETRGQPLPE
ncbi:MAG: MFS transporter [Thermoguttaceae bacterium]|jgi:MFS family permease